MPSLITHALFAQEVAQSLHNRIFETWPQLVVKGAQGPDFLFYNRSAPMRGRFGSSKLRKCGSRLHTQNVNAFYAIALREIRRQKNSRFRDEMIAYMAGHLCHWAMDTVFHPMVYARVGWGNAKASWNHHQYESLLDAAMLQYKKQQTARTFNPAKECIDDDPANGRACAAVYVPALKELCDTEVSPLEIQKTWQDYVAVQQAFWDPAGRKAKVFRLLEKPLQADHLLSGLIIPNTCEDNIDVCNLLHSSWKHPVTGQEHRESVFDLWETAKKRAKKAILLFLAACRDEKNESAFLHFLADRSYDTGMSGRAEMTFFDPDGPLALSSR